MSTSWHTFAQCAGHVQVRIQRADMQVTYNNAAGCIVAIITWIWYTEILLVPLDVSKTIISYPSLNLETERRNVELPS